MKKTMKRILALALCLMTLLSVVDLAPFAKAAIFYGDYTDVSKVYDYGSCPSMQGMAVGSQMIYTIKINGNDSLANIYMTDKDTGETTRLHDTSDGSYYFSGFGHANDMAVWGIDGYSQIFVTSTEKGMGAITRLQRDGSGLTRVAYYNLTYNGAEIEATAFDIMSVSNGQINFITKLGQTVYTGSVSTSATNATIPLTKLCVIDKSKVIIKGETLDLSDWVNQGFGYHDEMLYVPITGPDSTGELNRSVVCVYNLQDVPLGATIYPTDAIAFRVTSGAYSALFEIESVDICSSDKKLYFNTNRRVTDSNTNHDGVSYFDGYVFQKLTPNPNDIKSYTVHYNANGGTGTMEDTVVPYGVDTNLRKNAFTRPGYKFAGWTAYRTAKKQWFYTNGSSSGWYAEGSQPAGYTKSIYNDGVAVAATTSVDKDLVQMYAQWTVDNSTYTAKFDANGGTGTAMADMTFTKDSTAVLPECTYTNFGHTFAGWKVSGTDVVLAAGTALKNLTSYAGSGNTVTLQATWTANKHNVYWKINNNDYATTTVAYGQPITPPSYTVPDGYTFSGWNVPSSMPNYDLVLNATLTGNTIDINFYDENGTKLYTQQGVAYGTPPTYAGATPTKAADSSKHYTFAGWSTTKGGSVTGLKPADATNQNYYAVYTGTAHSYTSVVSSFPATCVTTGSVTKKCTCGATTTQTQGIDKDNHTGMTVVKNAVSATCGKAGYTGDTYCEDCNAKLLDGTTIPATGAHNYQNGICTVCGAKDPNYATDYYLVGYINGADYGCEGDYQNLGQYKFVNGKLTATFTQDSYVFLKTADNANWYMTQTYVTGTSATFYNTNEGVFEKMFVPGGKEITFTLTVNSNDTLDLSYTTASAPTAGSITLSGVTLSLEDEVLYNLYFTTSNMTVSADKMGLLVWDSEPTNTTINGGATVIPGATVSGSTYMVQTEGIPGKNLGDTLYLVAYAQLDNGSYVYSKVLPYSAKTYCMSRLEKSSDANLKALCVALLNYGASAQEYFAATSDYTYTTLMNADLTSAQKGLVQAYNSSMMAPRGTVTAAKAGVFGTTNNGYSLRSASMSADGIFSINYYFTTANPATTVTMYYWTEADFNAVSTLTVENATGSKKMVATGTANQFWADIDGIAAKDLDKTIYVCGVYFYNGVTYYTGVIPYSLGYYCSNKAENGGADIKPMAAATAVYSYYAKLYFNV